jgi:hypothetical protein
MDPYLEDPAFWPDFHATFINYWREALADSLPSNYEARIDEQICVIDAAEPRVQRLRPDVAISRLGSSESRPLAASGPAATLTLEPVTIPLALPDEIRESRIEILHRPDRSVVTILELLSPTNKSDLGYSFYLSKRLTLMLHPVHLVELDLLIGGRRPALERPYPPGHYFALVARTNRRPNCEVYSWTLRHRLPVIPIPLKAPDPDLNLDLSLIFATAYDRGRYARSLNYDLPPAVPLDEEDVHWTAEQIGKARAVLGGS